MFNTKTLNRANYNTEFSNKDQEVFRLDPSSSTGQLEKRSTSSISTLASSSMLLKGHNGEVLTMKFSPDGLCLATGSSDESILLWRVFSPECENFAVLKGHKNAVLELHWTGNGEQIVSCSPDCSVRVWDAAQGKQIRKMVHDAFVMSCSPAREKQIVVSGADNGAIKIWDLRAKQPVLSLWDTFPISAVTFAEENYSIYCGGIENIIKVWDLRQGEVRYELVGHNETITGLQTSPDGGFLLSNSMDNTLRIWDMRPFAHSNRCTNILTGHFHTFEKNLLKCDWSPDGSQVSAGNGNQLACIWDVASGKALSKFSGHNGTVNEVVFHPKERIIGSCSSDKLIYLSEITN